MLFTKPGFVFSCHTIEGEYVAIQKLVQQVDRNQEIRIKNTVDLPSALERVMLVSTQSNAPMEFIITARKLTLKAEAELGMVYETIAVETGEVIETSF